MHCTYVCPHMHGCGVCCICTSALCTCACPRMHGCVVCIYTCVRTVHMCVSPCAWIWCVHVSIRVFELHTHVPMDVVYTSICTCVSVCGPRPWRTCTERSCRGTLWACVQEPVACGLVSPVPGWPHPCDLSSQGAPTGPPTAFLSGHCQSGLH